MWKLPALVIPDVVPKMAAAPIQIRKSLQRPATPSARPGRAVSPSAHGPASSARSHGCRRPGSAVLEFAAAKSRPLPSEIEGRRQQIGAWSGKRNDAAVSRSPVSIVANVLDVGTHHDRLAVPRRREGVSRTDIHPRPLRQREGISHVDVLRSGIDDPVPRTSRPRTNGVSHSAPILAVTAGTPIAVLPSLVPVLVRVLYCHRSSATPPSNPNIGSDSPNTLSLCAAIALPPLSSWVFPSGPAIVMMLGWVISNRLKVVVKRPVSIFTPVSACVVLLGGNTAPTLTKFSGHDMRCLKGLRYSLRRAIYSRLA